MDILLPNICAWCGGESDKLKHIETNAEEITANHIISYKYRIHFYFLNLPICHSCEESIAKRKKIEEKIETITGHTLWSIPIIFLFLLFSNDGKFDSVFLAISFSFGIIYFLFTLLILIPLLMLILNILGYKKENDWGWISPYNNEIHFKNKNFENEFLNINLINISFHNF